MPTVFVGHGSPMNALDDNVHTRAWRRLGETLPRPKAILSVSAHWYIHGTAVTAMEQPQTIHDFYGFPPELFAMRYPAPGAAALASRVQALLQPIRVSADQEWGLDHGTWSVLVHLYPQADIPVVQLSIDATQPPAIHYQIGQRLAALRDEGVLIFGSGNVVHNLRRVRWGDDAVPYPWATSFNDQLRDALLRADHQFAIGYEKAGEAAQLSVPTPEHYLPLLYVLGASTSADTVVLSHGWHRAGRYQHAHRPLHDTVTKDAPLIELQHCSLILDGHTVLDEVSFALRRGERWALIGPNGSGKSMLLKMLRGDVWPTPSGRERRIWRVDGQVSRQPAGIKELIAYVGPERQDKYVRYGWNLTVAQVVTTGLFDEDIPLTRPTRAQRMKVERFLRRFSLWGLRNRHMLTLSYGQRRLTLVARAFASPARVLLLDEVFNGLDAKSKQKLSHALAQPRSGHDWIISSHRPAELPKNVTHVARIAAGRLVKQGAAGGPGLGTRDSSGEGRNTGSSRVPSPRSRVSIRDSQDPLFIISNADLYRDYRPVIRQLNWTLNRGEHWAVLGANGSGKSTLLSLIYGDLHPALGGSIERDGVPPGTRIESWKHRVGWVSPELQASHFAAGSLEEIVISGRYASIGLNEPATRADRAAASRWLRFFGLESLRHRGPRQVSYGQLRLALIARAMVNGPELLLLDEPCTGLDGDVREEVLTPDRTARAFRHADRHGSPRPQRHRACGDESAEDRKRGEGECG